MEKKVGIFWSFVLFFMFVFQLEVQAVSLRDNLRLEVNPVHTIDSNNQNKILKDSSSIKKEVINNIESMDLNSNLSNVEKMPMKPVNASSTAVQNIVFNDKVYKLLMQKNKPMRPNGIIYYEAQKEIDVVDPQKSTGINSNYPGLRGPNQLVVYTPSFGFRTGTNEFGTEAIVQNDMVVSLNGADSIIPQNGFVISGHGKAKKWILENIQVGSKIYVDYLTNSLNVFLTPESLIYSAKERLKAVDSLVEYYKNIDILYNEKKAVEHLDSAKIALRKAEKKPEKAQSYIEDAMKELNIAIKNAIPYINHELKGIWIRPVETSPSKIENTIEKIHKAGITDIFLETYFHGKTIYPSEYLKENGIIFQREEFIGFDPLEVWIKEAHKRKMKVHIWFETFYVGNDNPQTTFNHVLNVYPHWSNKRLMNYDSPVPVNSLSEHNGYFLDPSNIQVQTYLLSIIKEIIDKYNPDGINLDYIRYPQTVEPRYSNYVNMNWGYTENARNEFKYLYGIDPIDIKYETKMWEYWSNYRQNQITEFVTEVRKLTKANNINLTAVIFPDLTKSKDTKMQNWQLWSMNDIVDGFTPLLLTSDKNTAELLLSDVVRNTSPFTKIYSGLFVTFMGGSVDDLLIQIHKNREYRTKGVVLFDYAHLKEDYVDALTTRVFNKNYEPRDMKMVLPEQTKSDLKQEKKKKRKNKK